MPNNLTEMHVKRDSSSFLNVIIISTKLNKRPSCLISHPSIIDYTHNNDLPFLSEILQQGLYYEIYNFGTQQICKYDSHVCLGVVIMVINFKILIPLDLEMFETKNDNILL